MVRIVLLFVTVISAVTAMPAEAQVRRAGPPQAIGPPPPMDQAGCYFYRGRQWCGRYCYYEVNGKRYCQRREREAVPQAPLEAVPLVEGLK